MQATPFYQDIPLWIVYVFTISVVLLSVEAGYRVGRSRSRKSPEEKDSQVNGLVGATLGLLAFLLAFTFGAASTRYDVRRQMVLDEASAIGTTYLRAGLLPEPYGTEARKTLRDYAKLRTEGVTVLMRPEARSEAAALLDSLWNTATAAVAHGPDSPVTALFIQSLNEVIDLDEERITAGRNRIPGAIWGGLLVLTIFAMATVGYQFGLSGVRGWVGVILLMMAFTLVILLIVDLDRAQSGFIQVSQQPIIDLVETLGSGTP
jgi:hypothetical protein